MKKSVLDLRESYLDPHRLYTIRGFYAISGISGTRTREARRRGVTLNCIQVGRRKFVRGNDAISFIERLAEMPREDIE